MHYLNYIVSLLSMLLVLLDARFSVQVGEEHTVAPKEQTDMYNCYLRYVSEPLDNGAIIYYANITNVTKYIKHVQSTMVVVDIRTQKFAKGIFEYSSAFVIIVITNIKDIGYLFSILSRTPSANVRTRYLVIYLGGEPTDMIFELAWSVYILNIAVLRQDDASVCTYFPYGHGECGERIRSEVLGQCQQLSLAALYPAKVPKVFHGCTFRITTYQTIPAVIDPRANTGDPRIDGFENVMVNSIVERLNLSKVLNVSQAEAPYPNGTGRYWYPVYNLFLNISDMIFAQMRWSTGSRHMYETSYVYYLETMMWNAPVAGPGAQWMNVILVFQASMWYTVIGFFLLNSFVWWIFTRTTNYWHGSYLECLLGSLLVLLSGSVPFPKRAVIRFLVVSWTVCSLLVIAAYQCQFLSILLKPVYEKQVTNEQEIVESEVPVILWQSLVTVLQMNQDRYSHRILRRAQVLSRPEFTKYVFSAKKHAVFPLGLSTTKYYGMFNHNDSNARRTVYVFKEPISVGPICMFFRRGHPMVDRWNELLKQFVESGILGKLISDLDNSPQDIPEEPEKVPVNMRHLSCAFYILLIGYSAALLTFVVEKIVHRMKMKKQTRLRRQRVNIRNTAGERTQRLSNIS